MLINGIHVLIAFSLTNWLAARSIPNVASITEAQADSLYLELGLDHFMHSTDQCTLSDSTYGSATGGWKNGKYCNFVFQILIEAICIDK